MTETKEERIAKKVGEILTADESVELIVVQQALAGPKPDAVVLTNRRFIIYHEGLLRVTFDDWLWRDLSDCHLSESFTGATLTFEATTGTVQVSRLPKKEARRIYAYAQQKEQEAAETRRQRDMEEKRAAAGHIVVGPQQQAAAGPAADDPMAKLTKLKNMMDAGLITEEEYNTKKAQILEQM